MLYHIISYHIILDYIIFYYVILYFFVLHEIIVYYIALYYMVLYYILLNYIVVYYIILYYMNLVGMLHLPSIPLWSGPPQARVALLLPLLLMLQLVLLPLLLLTPPLLQVLPLLPPPKLVVVLWYHCVKECNGTNIMLKLMVVWRSSMSVQCNTLATCAVDATYYWLHRSDVGYPWLV